MISYRSTRDNGVHISAAQAIARGISADGGLFVPETLPRFDAAGLEGLRALDYKGRARAVLGGLLSGFSEEDIAESVDAAYGEQWDDPAVTPLVRLSSGLYLLELWHGPTSAFKDIALQLLPHLLTRAMTKTASGKHADILVATSGDTGKAALAGFAGVAGTSVTVFYPREGVSRIQKLQMTTQSGNNVGVCGIDGNFDDAQTAVKKLFGDKALAAELECKGRTLSSANSINWGRLAPQIVYYFHAYCALADAGEIQTGEAVNIAVPTGNFGNILAAWYALGMGLPVGKLICASNRNRVLTDFLATGVYDIRRPFYATTSPSMDILISSNLERLLHALTDGDDRAVNSMMIGLATHCRYEVPEAVKERLTQRFAGGFCDETDCAATIRETFAEHSYLVDPHTAVGLRVCGEYMRRTGDTAKTIVAATASPFKFAGSMLAALTGKAPADDFAQLAELERLGGRSMPPAIAALRGLPERHTKTCRKEDIFAAARELLGV